MKLAMAVLAVMLFIPAAHADSSPPAPPLIDVTFTTTFTSISGATETMDGSFEWQEAETGLGYIPGTATASASGFLGNVDLITYPGDAYLAFFTTSGDEIDLYMDSNGIFMNGLFNLFDCVSIACDNAYPLDPGFAGKGATETDITQTIMQTPEPPMLAMVLVGILPLAFVRRRINPVDVRG
jgi:hypothetical protein